MLGEDVNIGYCCNEALHKVTNCRAVSSHMCSGNSLSHETNKVLREHAKYAFCPFDGNKCGSQQRTLVSDFTKQTVRTSVAMSNTDVCPYVLNSETLLQTDVKIKV
jgi:hypothetical protein